MFSASKYRNFKGIILYVTTPKSNSKFYMEKTVTCHVITQRVSIKNCRQENLDRIDPLNWKQNYVEKNEVKDSTLEKN